VKGLINPLRFIAVSVPLFLLWEYWLRQPYLFGLAHVFAGSARLFGLVVHVMDVKDGNMSFVHAGSAWLDEFGLTGINVVALVALVLSTRNVSWKRCGRMLGLAVLLLVGTQVLGLWTDIVHVHLHTRAPGFANGLRAFMTGFGTFLFPLLIWLILVRDLLPLPGTPAHVSAGLDGP
jgi:hypothetical protein